jgi:hypothetical protein
MRCILNGVDLAARVRALRLPSVHSFEFVKDFHMVCEDFSVENGCLTPTMKLKRQACAQLYAKPIAEMYAFHAALPKGAPPAVTPAASSGAAPIPSKL